MTARKLPPQRQLLSNVENLQLDVECCCDVGAVEETLQRTMFQGGEGEEVAAVVAAVADAVKNFQGRLSIDPVRSECVKLRHVVAAVALVVSVGAVKCPLRKELPREIEYSACRQLSDQAVLMDLH